MSPRRPHAPGCRAVTPVVGVVILVALTVVLAAMVSAAALAYADELADPAPTVARSSGEYDRYATGGGRYTEQVVRITHEAGDTLTVANLELVVDACGRTGRLVNLPVDGDDPRPATRYVRGEDVFDNSYGAIEGPIGTGDVDDDGEWSAGETTQFRLATGECALESGDSITVRVVHTPTGSVLIAESIRAG